MIRKAIVEVLTPRQSAEDFDARLQDFALVYRKVLDCGCVVSVPDNPMGNLHFQAAEVIDELTLPVVPDQLLIHLNAFHTKESMDETLAAAGRLGVRHLLVVSGDGGERLPRLKPAALGVEGNAVTSIELLQYIGRTHAGRFTCGVAFNPYEPAEHELEKLRRKLAAGAEFVITQPIVGRPAALDALKTFDVPVFLGAWMSRKLSLLAACIGYDIPADSAYDPTANLKALQQRYPQYGIYLALVGFKTQLPHLRDWLPPSWS